METCYYVNDFGFPVRAVRRCGSNSALPLNAMSHGGGYKPIHQRLFASVLALKIDWGNMRWVSLFVLAAINLSSSENAYAAGDGNFRISEWVGRAYWNKQEKQLDHCSAQLTNADNITIIYSLDRQYVWSLEISSPAWNFTKGASFQVTLGLGDRGSLGMQAIAAEPQRVRVQLPDSLSVFNSFTHITQIGFVAGGLTSHFDLAYNNQILTALTKCVVRYGVSSRSRAAIVAWLKSSVGPKSNINDDASIHSEASALATNIKMEADIPKATSVPQNEVPAGLTGDAYWKVGRILFAVAILPHETSAVNDIPSLIIGGDAQKCRGDLFAGATIDIVGTLRVARAITNCLTPEATTTIYYLVVPRKEGGVYLLATATNGFEMSALGEPTAEEVDRKIRASIIVALSKSNQDKH
jgi:hypothetical protein